MLNPKRSHLFQEDLLKKLFGAVHITAGGIGVNIGIFQNDRGGFHCPGEAEMGQVDPQFREPDGYFLKLEGMAVFQIGIGLPAHAAVKGDGQIPLLAHLVDGKHLWVIGEELLLGRM